MKKYIHTLTFFVYLLLSTIIFLWYVSPVQAEWTRQPLAFTNDYTGWDETGKYQPTVLVENGQFKMWFSSYNGTQAKIGYATSPDGLHWTSHGPVLASPELDLGDPTVIHDAEGYVMWFSGNYPGLAGIRIYRATSTDGMIWESDFAPVLTGTPGGWDSQSVAAPFVFKEEGGVYRMWYSGYGSEWDVGLATSADGVLWEKYSQQLLTIAGGSSILKEGSVYKLYYERYGQCGYGIYSVESANGVQWNDVDTPEQVACTLGEEDNFIFAPGAVKNNNQTLVYFSGISTNGVGNILLASSPPSPTVTVGASTPTPSTIPSPTLVPNTPTPVPERTPVVFIPGLFGSWNKDAILHKQIVEPFSWTENPIVKEYDNVKNTFTRLGYQRDTDFYFFAYDWRKAVEKTADILNTYIREKVIVGKPGKKVILIGHSLGGLVSRIYAQKYGTANVAKIVTVGSPHEGTTKVYETLHMGRIEDDNSFLWLMERVSVELYRKPNQSVLDVVRKELPVLYDLVPTYNFLQTTNGRVLPVSDFGLVNKLLKKYADIKLLTDVLIAAGSKSYNTLYKYVVNKGGNPIKSILKPGDGVILGLSSRIGPQTIELKGNHGEIIYTKANLKRLLNALDIGYRDEQIQEGRGTKLDQSILVLVRSPVSVTVEHAGKTYSESQGIVFIENAQSGGFTIRARGTGVGKYSLVIGQLFNGQSVWKTIQGEITNTDPGSEEDVYTLKFNPSKKCFETHGTKRRGKFLKRLF
ncbi:MAG: alpha/beta fold hydrolase [Patescibacteria group bacterium]